ncbi:Phytanoyl-CoA dioxygenase, peroxisomal [Armadillidium vulgare]|nr:Phytanoyl-CoA dioxygenase, peroxisomal [Armadillidium vulgare]
MLSREQRIFYEENGFLVIKNLVKHEYLDRWRLRFLDLIEGRVYNRNITKMKDIALKDRTDIPPERVINKIQDFVWDEVLSEHCRLPEILDYIECFTGPNIMGFHTMLINKPPDPGTRSSRHPLHQDLYYFPFRPANRIVCAWTAMEKVYRDNGCLFVVPGSHKGKLYQHEYPNWENGVNKAYHGVKGFDDVPKQLLEMEKGDTVFFHPVLLHGSGDNITNRFRKAISCHYAASDCYYIDVKGTIQENITKEIEEIAKSKGLVGANVKLITPIFQIRDVNISTILKNVAVMSVDMLAGILTCQVVGFPDFLDLPVSAYQQIPRNIVENM